MTAKYILKTASLLCILFVAGSLAPANAFGVGPADKTYELESGLYYTVKKGDTLWDLSEHFFDSPWVWPDLWQKNKEIPNPHWIYPGNRIRIFSREGIGEIPEPAAQPKPMPEVEKQEPAYYLYPAIDSVGFVKREPVNPCGMIFGVKEEKVMISEGDFVYIQPSGGTAFRQGDRFTVFRKLKTLKEQETKAPVGVQYYIVGIVEITSVRLRFSTGRIVKSFRHIEINDFLMPYEARSPKIALTKSKTALKGKIVASEEHHMIFGDQAIVFINKGRKDGIQVGQSYSIYYQEEERPYADREETVLLSPVDFGDILVLHTEQTTATGLVTAAEKAIEPGAKIRTPPR